MNTTSDKSAWNGKATLAAAAVGSAAIGAALFYVRRKEAGDWRPSPSKAPSPETD